MTFLNEIFEHKKVPNDGISFKAGKRTTVLESGAKFYNFESVLESIKPKLQGIWTDLKKINDSIDQLTIFGN